MVNFGHPSTPLDTRHTRADNTPMKGKSRRERIASMSQAERDELMPLAHKVRAIEQAAEAIKTDQWGAG